MGLSRWYLGRYCVAGKHSSKLYFKVKIHWRCLERGLEKVELLSFVAVCPPYPPLSHYSDSTIIIDKARKYGTVGYKNFKRKRVIHRWKSTNKPTYQRPLSNSVKTCCFSIHLHGAFNTADPWIAQEVSQIRKYQWSYSLYRSLFSESAKSQGLDYDSSWGLNFSLPQL